MKTKTFVLVVAFAAIARADQAAESFVTGFSNALTQQMGGSPYQQGPPRQVPYVWTPPQVPPHYDIRKNYGDLSGYQFNSYRMCNQYLQNTGLNGECVWVE